MTREPFFLSIEQVLEMHAQSIEAHGGDPGLRDRGLLESAVAMPMARFGGVLLHGDMTAMSAAYLFHISKNHPFVDGNKRTSVMAAEIFLKVNGYILAASNWELEAITLSVADSSIGKAELTRRLGKFVKRRKRKTG